MTESQHEGRKENELKSPQKYVGLLVWQLWATKRHLRFPSELANHNKRLSLKNRNKQKSRKEILSFCGNTMHFS